MIDLFCINDGVIIEKNCIGAHIGSHFVGCSYMSYLAKNDYITSAEYSLKVKGKNKLGITGTRKLYVSEKEFNSFYEGDEVTIDRFMTIRHKNG
jgi:hypothetical protein